MTDILCFSGGLDSFVAWHYLNKPKTIYVDLRHKYAMKEVETVRFFNEILNMNTKIDDRLRMGDLEQPSGEIPLRNMLLATIASLYGDNVWLVFQRGETKNPSNDRSPEFCDKTSAILSHLHGKVIKIDSPFWDMTKQDMVKWYLDSGFDTNLLKRTVSCLNEAIEVRRIKDVSYHCGDCGSCFRKAVSLAHNDVDIVDMFQKDITKYHGIPRYIKKMLNGEYEERRSEQTLEVLKKWGWKIV